MGDEPSEALGRRELELAIEKQVSPSYEMLR